MLFWPHFTGVTGRAMGRGKGAPPLRDVSCRWESRDTRCTSHGRSARAIRVASLAAMGNCRSFIFGVGADGLSPSRISS